MKSRIFCAHAGGQGKTTAAQVVYSAAVAKGLDVKLAAADFIDDSNSSKLGRLFPGMVKELGTGPSVGLAKEFNDLSASIRYWDALGPLLLEGGYVIDMGANVIDQVLSWGEIRQAPKLLVARSAPPIDIYLVCKAEQRAVDDMTDLMGRFSSQTSLPVENIFVVLNEQGGSFDGLDIRSRLGAVVGNVNVEFITLPRCTSELWLPMEQSYTSIPSALAMAPEDLPDALNIDFWAVHSGMEDLSSWFNEVRRSLKSAAAL